MLAGLLLVVVPYIIHRIRRPERQEVRFSSLMFVPKVKKEVIERRKLQHLLLMLLRMLILALLILAFSRPFWPQEQVQMQDEPSAAYHLILVDRSTSMAMGDRMAQAKQAATDILRGLPSDAAADVVVYDANAQSLAGGFRTERGALTTALAAITAGRGAADLQGALQFAERRLLAAAAEVERAALNLHLVSDFQKVARTAEQAWKLSGQIRFHTRAVSSPWPANLAVSDLAVNFAGDQRLVVAAKIKNWDNNPRENVRVGLHVDGEVIASETLSMGPWSGAQVRFQLDADARKQWHGFVAVDDTGPAFDDRRYFVKPVPRPTEIRLLRSDQSAAIRGSGWFLERSLTAVGDQRWRLETLIPDQFGRLADDPFDVLILHDVATLSPSQWQLLDTAMARGAGLFILWGESLQPNRWAPLTDWQITVVDKAFSTTREAQFALPSEVQLNHPLFQTFQGPQFNDFSSLRLHNYWRLEAPDARVLGYMRTPGSERRDPWVLSGVHSEGRWVIWPFTANLAWTNLAKHVKFLPMVHETVAYLAPPATPDLFLDTGTAPQLQSRMRHWPQPITVGLPGGESWQGTRDDLSALRLTEPGILSVGAAGDRQIYAAVNTPSEESETAVQQPNEVALQWTTGGTVADSAGVAMVTQANQAKATIRREFGWQFLPYLAGLLFFEMLLAAMLSRRKQLAS